MMLLFPRSKHVAAAAAGAVAVTAAAVLWENCPVKTGKQKEEL